MDTQPRKVVQVRKYGDLINVAETTLKTRDEQIAELVSIHGAENVLIDGATYQDMQVGVAGSQQEQPEPTPILSQIQPDPMKIGEREVPQIDVIRAILDSSHLTVAEWNLLEEEQREQAISAAVETMVKSAEGQ